MEAISLNTPLTPPISMQCTQLHQKIRNAIEPDNPGLIKTFLLPAPLGTISSKVLLREYLTAQFQLLMETIADDYLPTHWRSQCLDHIHIPLLALNRLVDCEHSKEQVLLLFQELRITSHYLQPSLDI